MHFDLEVFDITVVVLIICIELIYIKQVISHVLHLFIDNQFFVVLSKLETIHETLIQPSGQTNKNKDELVMHYWNYFKSYRIQYTFGHIYYIKFFFNSYNYLL